MAERWLGEIWLGKRWATDEHVVSMPGGKVARARAIHEFPVGRRWDADALLAVTGAPWAPSGTLTYKLEQPVIPEQERTTFADAEELVIQWYAQRCE